MKKKINYSGYTIIPLTVSLIIMFICIVIIMILGKYGVQGLYRDVATGVLEVCFSIMMLFILFAFIKDIVKKIKRGSIDYKSYFIGLLELLRSAVIIFALLVFITMAARMSRIKAERRLYVLAAIIISAIIIVFYIKHCKKQKSKQKDILKDLMAAVFLPLVTCVAFYGGCKCTYDASSDLITKKTVDVILTNINVEKKVSCKSGTSYTLRGYDRNNNKMTAFSITRGTYNVIKADEYHPLRVVYYEKSRVINNIYELKLQI